MDHMDHMDTRAGWPPYGVTGRPAPTPRIPENPLKAPQTAERTPGVTGAPVRYENASEGPKNGEQRQKEGKKAKRKKVKAAQVRLDEGRNDLGLVPGGPGFSEVIRDARRAQDPPDVRAARRIAGDPALHSRWIILPLPPMGSVKAKATARAWDRTREVDGAGLRFHAVAYPRGDTGARMTWGVAVLYDPDDQPRARGAGNVGR